MRDAARAPDATTPVVGDVRDGQVLERAVHGADAVVSALGPVKGERDLHATLAPALVAAMDAAEQSKPAFRSPNALPTPAADQENQIEKLDQRCEICFEASDPGNMLLCDACDGGYHTFCLKVRLVPEDSPLTHTL